MNGDFVQKNYQKAAECYENSYKIEEGNDSCYQLGVLYEKGGEGLEINIEKSAHFYYLSSQKKHLKSQEKFLEIIKNFPIEWKRQNFFFFYFILFFFYIFYFLFFNSEYHKFWPMKSDVNGRIIIVFLISKNRNDSKIKYTKFLVKGIANKVVKYLCIYEKLENEENEENK